MKLIPDDVRECNGGIQKLFKFKNGFGASVVRHDFSYGHEAGLWELGVLSTKDKWKSWNLNYSTKITKDVIGHLSEKEVQTLLNKIKKLDSDKGDE